MVTGISVSEETELNPMRPSIIMRRVDERGLWEIAKQSGSTVERIRKANHLDGDPVKGQMLMIPVQ